MVVTFPEVSLLPSFISTSSFFTDFAAELLLSSSSVFISSGRIREFVSFSDVWLVGEGDVDGLAALSDGSLEDEVVEGAEELSAVVTGDGQGVRLSPLILDESEGAGNAGFGKDLRLTVLQG